MSDLQQRLFRNRHLSSHLNGLASLVNGPVSASDLLSPQEVSRLREKIDNQTRRSRMEKFQIPFEEKLTVRFKNLVNALHEMNSSPIYVWTPLSNDCGLLQVESLRSVDYSFGFDVVPEGLFSLVTVDLLDEMLLDFSEDDRGKRILEIELYGLHWSGIGY
jgi:hypothetical protein